MSSTLRSVRFARLLAAACHLLVVVGSGDSNSTAATPGGPLPPLNVTQGGNVSAVSNVSCDVSANISQEADNRGCLHTTSSPSPAPKVSKADYVGYVLVPFLLLTGLCGNSLTVVVMMSKYFRHMSVSILLIALACSDNLLILLVPFNKLFVIQLLGVDIRAVSQSGCKAFFFFWRCAKMTSSWFIVLICLERFVAVWFPLKTALICSKRNTLMATLCVYLVMFSYNGAWTFASALVKGTCRPHHSTPDTKQVSHAFLVAGTMLYSIVPTILLLLLTPSICYKLVVQARQRRAMASCAADDHRSAETTKTNAMLIGVSLAFVLLVAPVSTAHSVSFLGGQSFFYSKELGMTILRETAQVMEQMNYSINFFLYVICCKSFRTRVLEFLGCKTGPRTCRKSGGSSKIKITRASSPPPAQPLPPPSATPQAPIPTEIPIPDPRPTASCSEDDK